MITTKPATYPAIPLDVGQIHGWKSIPTHEVGSLDPLVPLGPLSNEAAIVTTSSLYFGEHGNSPYAEATNKLEGSLLTLFARRSTARRLLAAERSLPSGYHLLVFDAYRPYQVQKSLHDFYKQKLSANHPAMNDEALELETQHYVSLPSTDPTRPSPHSTGGVVDVVIVKLDQIHEAKLARLRSQLRDTSLDFAKRVDLEMQLSAIMRHHAKMLDFGTAFDHGGEKSATAYYESKIAAGEVLTEDEMLACNNRRLLFRVMTRAGFQPYFAEWWHFDAPESQWGAASAGRKFATFGAASLDKDNIAHENIRLKVRQEMLKVQKEAGFGNPLRADNWPAEIIAPPTDL